MIGPDAYSWILLLPVALAGFVLPGYLLTRLIPSPCVPLSAFLGSILVLFWVVLGNQFLGFPLNGTHVAGGLALVLLGLALAARHKTPPPQDPSSGKGGASPRADHILYLMAVLLGVVSIVARAAIDPLSGYDNAFRWNGLSLSMLHEQSLSFYPAVGSEGFARYAWCDGIAPLVSSLNFWLYLGTGSTAIVMTVARIGLEAGILFFTIFQFARSLWGSRSAGWAAMGMFATSSLALWSVAMGQETGLTALTLVATLYFLHVYAQTGQKSHVLWAGMAAAAGALSREYGLAYIVIGAVILAIPNRTRPGLVWFVGVAVILSAPWYLRNAWLTGNPVYSMNVLGLFPVNKPYAALMEAIVKNCSLSSQPQNLHYLAILPPLFMGGVLLGGLAGVFRLKLKSAPLVLSGLVITALWVWSIGQTAGGWVYSMRVLSPMLAIAAVLAGNLALLPFRIGIVCAVAAVAISVDAARRAWHFPSYSLTSAWSLSFDTWEKSKNMLMRLEAPELWSILSKAAGDKAILVDHPSNHVLIRRHLGHVVPLFSPQVACIYDAHKPFKEVIAELRRRNIRFITLIDGSPINDDFNRPYPFFRELRQDKYKVASINGLLTIYDVEMITALLAQTPASPAPPR